MRVLTLLVALELLVGFPTASVVWAASEHYYDFIAKVQIPDDNNLYINAPGNFVNDDHCSNPWFAVSKHPLSDDRTRAQLQVALASFLGHQKVYVVTNGCSADGRLILEAIQLEQP
jgi:hypothetical protein